MANVVHVTTVHPRYDIRIFRKECLTLEAAGFDVQLVVADGKGDEGQDGVTIHDIGLVRGRLKRMTLLPMRAFFHIRRLKPSLVHFHDPEFLPVGYLLRLSGLEVIYDSHEDLPRAILSKEWIRPTLRRAISGLSETIEDFCARRMSAIVAATPHIASRFDRINPRTISVTNYPVISENDALPERKPENAMFIYVGAISRKRAALEMVIATKLAGARLYLAGPFEDAALEAEMRKLPEWDCVTYLGYVDQSALAPYLSKSMAGLLMFYPEPNHINSVPNKMFEYMASALPILCSNFESWKSIVLGNSIGLFCDPTSPENIAGQMKWIIEHRDEAEAMGTKARVIVHEKYRWQNEACKLVALYNRILGKI
ncbi:glycosyltransferase involved in cell wall biosynthesis [Rhizobium aquaticum]|uniref:Glycosyltransferase involved in cell wall biosynthesis n=1 Tax=Rhizobium aquaticum TaxID=1549636 RepID=A0ABV2J5B8_9HYPH